jgi:hypothetical protein
MWEAWRMPWVPELFSAPALERLEEKRRHELVAVPYFDGLMAAEPDALINSFAGEPELHHPVRGRIKGARAFEAIVGETNAWLRQRNVLAEDVEHVVTERRGFEEVVLHLDGETGRVELPVAIVADRQSDGRIVELRIYFSSWPLTGCHANRPPLLQPDPELRESDVVAEYQRAQGRRRQRDRGGIRTARLRPRACGGPVRPQRSRRPARLLRAVVLERGRHSPGTLRTHRRRARVRAGVQRGAWGKTELPPEAGVAVYVRGQSGKLAAARIYDDADPPLR